MGESVSEIIYPFYEIEIEDRRIFNYSQIITNKFCFTLFLKGKVIVTYQNLLHLIFIFFPIFLVIYFFGQNCLNSIE